MGVMKILFRGIAGLLVGLVLGTGSVLGAHELKAENGEQRSVPHDSVASDTTDSPNQRPYTTNRSVLYHVLASPAYVLHGVTRPLGWGVRYLERNAASLFAGELPPRFVLPLVDIGGPTGVQAGLLAYDNRLFGSAHSAQLRALYGGPNTFDTQLTYNSPSLFGVANSFQLQANVFSNPESGFFLDGNDSDKEADDASANRDQIDVTVGIEGTPIAGVDAAFDLLYEHVETSGGDDAEGERLEKRSPPGLGTVDLLTSRLTLGGGRTRNEQHSNYRRAYFGTDVILQLDYTHDLTADRFRYGRYALEVRQYLPVGLLPQSRRFVLMGHLEQVEPLFEGSAVPFFQKPTLGGQNTLRGFTSSRFQADGALAGSAEYRYPIWNSLDALVLVDAGQVFDSFGDITADRFHWSYGGGIHLLAGNGLGFRFELAHSAEGLRTILTVNSSFQRSAR